MTLTRVSIDNPVFATMTMAAIMILGIFSYQRLSVEQMPDISIPVAVVRTPYPGASAEAVEQEVTRRVEEAVNTVSGIKTIRSGSAQGFSWVVAEFELDIDIKTAISKKKPLIACGVDQAFRGGGSLRRRIAHLREPEPSGWQGLKMLRVAV